MIKNKLYVIISALIICCGLIFFGLSNRYYIDAGTKLKVDKLTGKTYQLKDSTWKEVGKEISTTQPVQAEQATKDAEAKEKAEANAKKEESIKNLELFKTLALYNEYKNYYNDIMDQYNKDPLFYKSIFGETYKTLHQNYYNQEKQFQNYSEMISITNICATAHDKDVKTADGYIEYLANYYKNQ